MLRIISVIIMLSILLPVPVRAGLVTDFDPVERNLIDKKALEDRMTSDFNKPSNEQAVIDRKEKSGSSWWKWTLGILLVGGAAAAAAGGGGGEKGGAATNPPSGGTGSTTVTW